MASQVCDLKMKCNAGQFPYLGIAREMNSTDKANVIHIVKYILFFFFFFENKTTVKDVRLDL